MALIITDHESTQALSTEQMELIGLRTKSSCTNQIEVL